MASESYDLGFEPFTPAQIAQSWAGARRELLGDAAYLAAHGCSGAAQSMRIAIQLADTAVECMSLAVEFEPEGPKGDLHR